MTLVPNAVDVDAYLGGLRRGPTTCPRDRWSSTSARCTATGSTWTSARRWPPAVRGARPSCSSVPWPSTPRTRRCLTGAGAVLLGAREHTTIPAYLKNADVLVVPHVVTEFTDSLDPIKVYEYLAAARPVVSTPVAGFRELEADHVVVVPGSDFLARTQEHLASPSPAARPEVAVPGDDRATAMRTVVDGVAIS